MRQLNIFISLLLIFIFVLITTTILYIFSNNSLSLLIELKMPISQIGLYILHKIILLHKNFVIFSLVITIILFYGFSEISLFKSRHYRTFILIIPLLLSFAIYYTENFYLQYSDTKIRIKKNIDYKNIFLNRIKIYKTEKGDNLKIVISKINRSRIYGFAIYENKLYKIKRLQFNINKNSIRLLTDDNKKIDITLYTPDLSKWESIFFSTKDIHNYIFILFILIPLALLFNNRLWYLRTLIFLIISTPLYIYAFQYLNKALFSINLNLKFTSKFITVNEIIVLIIYILIGNFLFKFADSVRNIKPRIDIAKVKKINT